MLAVHVLGRVEVVRDGSPVDLGGPQQRAVIAHLAVDAGRVVSVDRLIDRLWGDELPRTPLGTLQSYVSRLRRAIEPERSVGSAPRVLVSEAPGYMLRIPSDQIDVHRFASLVGEARIASSGADHRLALDRLDAALALWHGPALAGVGPDEQVRPLAARFEEEHQSAVEDRFDVLLALGRHAGAVPALQSAVDEHPLRERRWSQLALALYRSSRQADALRALSTARSTLLDELGLDPGPELRVLEQRILAHDPALMVDRVVDRPPVVLAPPHEVNTPQLVGRSTEWEALLGALDRTSADGARLLLLDGEPGIGKSTLCEALLAHATTTGWHTAVGRCVESGLAPSLWPCIEVVRALVAAAAETTGPPSSPLGQLVAADRRSPTPLSRVEMADQFVALLDELGDVPRVIVLDDLHWADRATLDVVALVLERLGRRRVLVVGAYRPPELVPGSLLGEALGPLARPIAVIRIPMSPLDVAGVARLMQVTTGSTPSGEVAKLVHHRAGGNPLFVAELARLAGERGLDASSAVPDAVRDVVRSRLALLPEGTSAELQLAAIMGERFDVRTLIAASERDPDACLDALDAAIVTRILVADGDEWRFAHALVRDAVMAEISLLRRARLHHRVADAILATHGDGPDRAEPIAHHRLASSAIGDPIIVARAAIRASDVARWRGALDAAESLSERALEVLAGATRSPVVDEAVVEALEALAGAAFRRGREDDRAVVAARVDAIAHRVGSDDARALALYLNWGEIDEVDDLTEVLARTERAPRPRSQHRERLCIGAHALHARFGRLPDRSPARGLRAHRCCVACDGGV